MLLSMVVSATAASAQNVAASAQKQAASNQITLRGKVEAVDTTARTVTIRGDQGNVVTLDVPQSVTRLDQVQVGDVVSVSYYDRVSIRPKPPGEAAVDRTEPPVTTATPGALPGATVATQRVTTVTLTGWDPATRVVTFTGPSGASYQRRLLETTDASVLAALKVGDRVDVTRTEAARLAVESRTAVQVDATEDFRHRFTISALWGWDNQFSGKMIQDATGQTTTGAPINLNETTFDDVYGRMANFKIGVGYRTSPRSEAVVNLIISRSSSETIEHRHRGYATTRRSMVDFGDYNYWGFEGGQRFFFARVRFTPYVGYLVGINRHDDITGVFVNVPANVTPGLAAQDGKFFEKSWALSFGPTGGVLIGLGPFEVMAETQLRFMGGLSDVDWLVEEGLRDINSESSRWSIPVQLGARIRF